MKISIKRTEITVINYAYARRGIFQDVLNKADFKQRFEGAWICGFSFSSGYEELFFLYNVTYFLHS